MKRTKKLVRPVMASSTQLADVYMTQCGHIVGIISKTFFLWRARRKIRLYLESTGSPIV